jgi:ABC-2 type transport system ATP-binding protein
MEGRLERVLDELVQRKRDVNAAPPGPDAIVVESLGKTYPNGTEAVRGVTFRVTAGECYGLLGPNGAGKSTTVGMLGTLVRPTSGRATVAGFDVVAQPREVRRRIGFAMQEVGVDAFATARELLVLQGRLHGLARAEATLQAGVLLAMVDLTDVADKRLGEFSGGMQRRVDLAAALMHLPQVVFLDEPTEGLDPLMQKAFYTIMDDLRRDGRTIFFSSHILSEVERICDRVAIIRAGHLMALQHVDELLARRKRTVHLQWRDGTPDLSGVPGLADVTMQGDKLSATLLGPVAPFVRAVASPELLDLTIEPASLEEAFLEYYAEDLAPEEVSG